QTHSLLKARSVAAGIENLPAPGHGSASRGRVRSRSRRNTTGPRRIRQNDVHGLGTSFAPHSTVRTETGEGAMGPRTEDGHSLQSNSLAAGGPNAGGTAKKPNTLRRFFTTLGPGFITGASDDDPAGIGTYAMAGAAFGYATLWMALVTFPMMATIQSSAPRWAW